MIDDDGDISMLPTLSRPYGMGYPYMMPQPTALDRLASSHPELALHAIARIGRIKKEVAAIDAVRDVAVITARGQAENLIRQLDHAPLKAGEDAGYEFHVSQTIPGTGGFLCGPDRATLSVQVRIWRR